MSAQGTAGATSPRLSGQQYRELFEESHDAILITERDGVILDANHAASELFAWPHADFLGMNVRRIYANAEDRARFQEQIEREGYVRDFEVVCVTRDGRRLDCLMTTVVRRAPDGSVSGYQGIVRDISERRQLERERREYHDQLRFAGHRARGDGRPRAAPHRPRSARPASGRSWPCRRSRSRRCARQPGTASVRSSSMTCTGCSTR